MFVRSEVVRLNYWTDLNEWDDVRFAIITQMTLSMLTNFMKRFYVAGFLKWKLL